jgi:hypothetical protein
MQETSASANSLLDSISAFCKQEHMAESTFGRRAVNDGKFVSRLREGARVTPETWDRVTKFISTNGGASPAQIDPRMLHLISPTQTGSNARLEKGNVQTGDGSSQKNFRFFDNRQKYLLFVNTCSEKEIIARRVGMELGNIHPRPPAIRIFDAGMGDGSVLTKVMRELHRRFPTMPFYITSKEISLEDVRLSLAKMADRFFEHPATVLIVTNMYYAEAPWLSPLKVESATAMIWKEVPLAGTTAHEFDDQLNGLKGFLGESWQALHSPKTGNPIYERPVALVIYREDYRFLLDNIIPNQGQTRADYDLVIASQPYRLRVSPEFKAQKVLAPLARALGKGGRLLGIHSYGADPGLDIIQQVWPGEDPYRTNRHDLLRALKAELGKDSRRYNFNTYSDTRAIFRFDMHTLPTEVTGGIGTSTLFAAWNAAVYVAQIEDQRLIEKTVGMEHLEITNSVLHKHGGLWFNDESYIVSRKRD